MKHDFRDQPNGEAADRFRLWLEQETIASLRKSYGDRESTKSAIFLYVNRAYESRSPESEIGGLFGTCLVRAGFSEEDKAQLFSWLEFFTEIAAPSIVAPNMRTRTTDRDRS
jgi:hypothetical protein